MHSLTPATPPTSLSLSLSCLPLHCEQGGGGCAAAGRGVRRWCRFNETRPTSPPPSPGLSLLRENTAPIHPLLRYVHTRRPGRWRTPTATTTTAAAATTLLRSLLLLLDIRHHHRRGLVTRSLARASCISTSVIELRFRGRTPTAGRWLDAMRLSSIEDAGRGCEMR